MTRNFSALLPTPKFSLRETNRSRPEFSTPNRQDQSVFRCQRPQTPASKRITKPNHALSIDKAFENPKMWMPFLRCFQKICRFSSVQRPESTKTSLQWLSFILLLSSCSNQSDDQNDYDHDDTGEDQDIDSRREAFPQFPDQAEDSSHQSCTLNSTFPLAMPSHAARLLHT